MSDLRSLPAVEWMLQQPQVVEMIGSYGRPLTTSAIRQVLADTRERLRLAPVEVTPDGLIKQVDALLSEWLKPTLQPVINATGVVLHTNLGRAPLSKAALQAMSVASQGYSTLEFDLSSGQRGSRNSHAEAVLARLTGAEAALVVNNNAAAVLLVLSTLCRRKRAIIARSQLVEIGGGFRVPAVMEQSGARLVEIGTTNRVHLEDYRAALEEPAAVVLRVHPSNFKIIGFTTEPEFGEVVDCAHAAGAVVVDDLGSGALLDTAKYGLGHEPTVFESLAAGADVICFSGDKLLGGPQAGIVIGRKTLVDKIRRHPLARVVRADKITLAALNATLLHYLKDEAEHQIPIWQMISQPLEQIRQRAESWQKFLNTGTILAAESTIGGGSLPGEVLPTCVLALEPKSPNQLLSRLRKNHPAVIARVENDRILLDPRTVLPDEEATLLRILAAELQKSWRKNEK